MVTGDCSSKSESERLRVAHMLDSPFESREGARHRWNVILYPPRVSRLSLRVLQPRTRTALLS